MPIKLANNASGTLATAINASDTGVVLTTGNGVRFPTLGVNEYFYATLTSAQGTQEVVKATARSGDSLTIVRAQEGTSAAGFAAGSRFELRITAQSIIDVAALYANDPDANLRSDLAAANGYTLIGGFLAVHILPAYTGNSLKTLRVNSGATDIEWAAINAGTILPSYTGNSLKMLRVNSGATDVEWAPVPNELPAYTGNSLKTLRVNSGATDVEWAAVNAGTILPSYTGNSLKTLRVNSGATDIEWAPVPNELPAYTGNALKILRVNSGATAIEWVTPDAPDLGLSQTIVTGDYTLVAGDANRQIFHPGSDITNRTVTIPSNASVPFAIGTTFTFINDVGAGTLSVAITSDTLQRVQSTGSPPFTLTANAMATAVKVTSTKWVLNGIGLA